MAKLELIVHTALEEVRMQILGTQVLGTQVLFGFGLQGAFQESFADTLATVRDVDAVGLSLLVVTLALLIAGPSCSWRARRHPTWRARCCARTAVRW